MEIRHRATGKRATTIYKGKEKQMKKWMKKFRDNEAGYGGTGVIVTILLAFVAILVVLNLVAPLVDADAINQADTDAHDITKLASGMGQWLLPLAAVIAGAMLVFRKIGGK